MESPLATIAELFDCAQQLRWCAPAGTEIPSSIQENANATAINLPGATRNGTRWTFADGSWIDVLLNGAGIFGTGS